MNKISELSSIISENFVCNKRNYKNSAYFFAHALVQDKKVMLISSCVEEGL